MLTIAAENTGDVVVLRCAGRIVRGEAVSTLRTSVISRAEARIMILDLAQVELFDAGGLAALLSLHEWACGHGVQLKLVNLSPFVYKIFVLTRLNRVFDISSLDQILRLLRQPVAMEESCHRSAPMAAC
jgi:anti-anti-sigma factor